MRILDDKLDAAQTAPGEFAHECRPERLRLRWTDIHTQDLAPAIAVDADCDDHCHRDDAPALAHLHIGRVNRLSTERVDTPCTYASCTTAVSAFSASRRGSRNPGK